MSKISLAVVTMVYNEPTMLPLWYKYYSKQVGPENCYIIDHGSDDFSTRSLENRCSITRIPRVHHSDSQRASIVGRFCEALLSIYERVIYVDSDEIIVAEPLYFEGLIDYCEKQKPGVITMFGFDLVHDFDNEPPIDLDNKILAQRKWVRPSGFNCKPSLINRGVLWWNGFHGYDGGNQFDNIYLFHLANFDKSIIKTRQLKRNLSAPVDGGGNHHKIQPDEMVNHIRKNYLEIERVTDANFTTNCDRREKFLSTLFDSDRPRETLHMKNHGNHAGLWMLPDRFKNCF